MMRNPDGRRGKIMKSALLSSLLVDFIIHNIAKHIDEHEQSHANLCT